jgi:hypothetical protein
MPAVTGSVTTRGTLSTNVCGERCSEAPPSCDATDAKDERR